MGDIPAFWLVSGGEEGLLQESGVTWWNGRHQKREPKGNFLEGNVPGDTKREARKEKENLRDGREDLMVDQGCP